MKNAFVATMAAACAAVPAKASTTLTFEGQNNTEYNAPITRDGFVIGNPVGQEQHFHEISSTQFDLPSNGTGVLLNDRDTQIFLTAVGGAAFTLNSLDIAAAFGNLPANGYTVTAFFGGSTVGSLSGTFGTSYITLAGFGGTAIDRVVFDGIGGGGGFVLDNIVLNNAVAGVPEPATWAMMMLGFGAMGAALRRRKTETTARIRFA